MLTAMRRCVQVDHLAKKANTGQQGGENSQQLEQLTCTNRQQATQIQSLTQAAAQREALIGQLQAQLATVRMHDQQLQQQLQAEREQHQQVARQVCPPASRAMAALRARSLGKGEGGRLGRSRAGGLAGRGIASRRW